MKDFINVLKTPRTVIYKTYPARESLTRPLKKLWAKPARNGAKDLLSGGF